LKKVGISQHKWIIFVLALRNSRTSEEEGSHRLQSKKFQSWKLSLYVNGRELWQTVYDAEHKETVSFPYDMITRTISRHILLAKGARLAFQQLVSEFLRNQSQNLQVGFLSVSDVFPTLLHNSSSPIIGPYLLLYRKENVTFQKRVITRLLEKGGQGSIFKV
jgi:hypothetical protein